MTAEASASAPSRSPARGKLVCPCRAANRRPRADLRGAGDLDFHRAVPALLDVVDVLQARQGRHAGPPRPLARLRSELEGMAVARPVPRHHLHPFERSRRVPQQVPQQRHRLDRRIGPGRRDRLARGLRAQPIRIQVRAVAKQGHFLLLPVAVDPAAGGPGDAVPHSLQGAGAARHADRLRSWSTP